MLKQQFQTYLSTLQEKGLYRSRYVNSKKKINFSSNDYLSLTNNATIKNAYQSGFKHYPAGSGGSMFVNGYSSIHEEFEKQVANALDVDQCVLFTSGYSANLSVINLLSRFLASIFIDKHVHASIYDGLNLSAIAYTRYAHNNIENLQLKLQKMPSANSNRVLVTESVFSMSGQIAPLEQIATLCQQYSTDCIVDEAHAFGLYGEQGLGAVVANHLTQKDVPLRIIPLGKAFAASGALVAGDGVWIEALLQFARPQIYSTAISPAIVYGLLKTFELVRTADRRRAHVFNLVRYFREAIGKSSLNWRDSCSPIQQLRLGCPHYAVEVSKKLHEKGIICMPMRLPTVSTIDTGLRVIINHDHQYEQIDYLFKTLHEL